MLLQLKEKLENKGFHVITTESENVIQILHVWNPQTNELTYTIETIDRVSYIIRTYELDNLSEKNRIELDSPTTVELESALDGLDKRIKGSTLTNENE